MSATVENVGVGDGDIAELELWKPGATTTTGSPNVSYPNTPFGYTYGPGEEGAIVHNDNDSDTLVIVLVCTAVEAPPTYTATSITTSLTGGGRSGGQISVPRGTPVSDTATLSGANVAGAGGTVTYTVYSDTSCSIPVASGGTKTVTGGSVPMSDPVTLNTAGSYRWRAVYSGDTLNGPSSSNCSDEIETVSARGSGPVLDHFACYAATSTPTTDGLGFNVPANVQLANQFSPNGFVPQIGAVDLHCNPTQKTVPAGVTKITNPNAHLACWNITTTSTQAKTVNVTNQFGNATLKTGATNQLCLPSWKRLTGPPNNPSVAPPGLNHFACSSVTYAPGTTRFRPPTSVRLQDQFSTRSVKVKVGAPKLLCLPTTKTVNGVTTPIQEPTARLLCYAVSATPTKNPVYDQNQFGSARVNIQKTKLLCVPSTKIVVRTTG